MSQILLTVRRALPLILFISWILLSVSAKSASLNYTISFPEPQTHYVDVQMEIKGWKAASLEIKMPVWAPGSYLVREFSRHVESVNARDAQGNVLVVNKKTKNSWTILTPGVSHISISYKVYAYELSVRTSFVDEEHAYLNGTSIFMYVEQLMKQSMDVKVIPYPGWKQISVALDRVEPSNPWLLKAPDYDGLVDAPFEIGNHVIFNFTAAGIPHEVAMFGEGNYNVDRLKKDMARIVEECTAIFGEHPCKNYLFIIHNLTAGGGGLEHMNSTTLQTNRWSYASESSYTGFLSLVAHEYFHLWNVKRLRPAPLGMFNYSEENYTDMLWLAEGFTAYYDDLIVHRCGFTSEAEYLSTLAGNISYCMNIKGAAIQSLAESSLDAWIKYYRPGENSPNATVSYYTKGGVVGALLNMEIMKATQGKKSLDDVFREMYRLYAVKLNRGFTETEFVNMVKLVSGKNMDDFFRKYVHGTAPLPVADFADVCGLDLVDLNEKQGQAWTGLTTSFSSGKLMVTGVERNSPAWQAGLNVNDELIALNRYRLADDLPKFLAMQKPGDTVSLTASRSGFIRVFDVQLAQSPAVKYSLERKE
ncbi:MAG: M61 family metallopeptidase, partial [Bacteroidia bacterium]|nr:M61 family metallopeptidase [Bacteroidia bacterium]